jgi:hypothetical protein
MTKSRKGITSTGTGTDEIKKHREVLMAAIHALDCRTDGTVEGEKQTVLLITGERPGVRKRTVSMNVRFTLKEKNTLERLAAREDRSQAQILSRLMAPVLREAARKLEMGEE